MSKCNTLCVEEMNGFAVLWLLLIFILYLVINLYLYAYAIASDQLLS